MSDNKIAYYGKDFPVHTNAPWRIEGDQIRTSISSGVKHVAMVNYFNCGSGDPRTITDEEHEANAKLIASAPEMLEVLRWLDAEMDCRDDDCGWVLFSRQDFEKVSLAINKAMGRDQEDQPHDLQSKTHEIPTDG